MLSFWHDYKTSIIKNKKPVLLSLSLTLILAVYFIIWHYTGLRLIGSYSVIDVSGPFMRIAAYYLAVSVFISSITCAVLPAVKRQIMKKIIIAIILFFFFISGIIRILDWGALYFGGNHIDGNFWAHAFYSDGLVFLATKVAVMLYLALAIFMAILFYTLKKISLLNISDV
jgi:hypothetical protein